MKKNQNQSKASGKKSRKKPAKVAETQTAVVQLTPEQIENQEKLAAFVRESQARRRAIGPRRAPEMVDRPTAPGRSMMEPKEGEYTQLFFAQLGAATGTYHHDAAIAIYFDLYHALHGSDEAADAVQQALSGMIDIAPEDGTEGMLAAQMVTTHRLAMKLMGRALRESRLDAANSYTNQASRLMRLFTLQMEALEKRRGKGVTEQKVTVTHVHVNAGANAVIGNVSTPAQLTGGPGALTLSSGDPMQAVAIDATPGQKEDIAA